MQVWKEKGKASLSYIKALFKWVVLAVIVGGIGGSVGSLFHICIDRVTEYRTENGWVIFLLPIGGLLIAGLYQQGKKQGKIDTNRVLEAVQTEEKVPFIMLPFIFISTVLTHLLGGSAGREGAALQLGGTIGYRIGKLFRLDKGGKHFMVMTGMSAVFSALFGTPLTAAFFAIEVSRVGMMQYAALVPCVVSALTAAGIADAFGIPPVRFALSGMPGMSPAWMGKVVVLTVLCALLSIVFCTAMKRCEHFAEKRLPNPYIRGAVGGLVLVLLTCLLQTRAYNGAGMDVITRAIGGEASYAAFFLKMLFTVITISAGFKGGEIVPTFFIGSTFGCAFGPFLGIDASFAAAIGFVALFCGVVNCPVASLLLAAEVFGGGGLSVFGIVCAVSYMMSGNFGLYKSQLLLYNKTDETTADTYAK